MELVKKLKARLASRENQVAAAQAAEEATDLAEDRAGSDRAPGNRATGHRPAPGRAVSDDGAGDTTDGATPPQPVTPRRGLFEPEPLPIAVMPTEVKITSSGAESDEAVPKALKIAAAWAWRIFLVAGLVYFVGWVLGFLSEVVIPVAVAILLAAMLKPLANRLHSWGLGRGPSAALTLLGGILLISGALTLIINSIAGQAGELGQQVVSGFNQLVNWLQTSPLNISDTWFNLDEWGTRIQKFLVDSQSTIATYAGDIGTQVGHFLAGIAICLFSLFYFLYDGRGIFSFVLNLMPRQAQPRADAAALRGWQSLSAYVRATVLVALVDAIGVLIVALILRVPLAPALAALVFLGAFIPLVGAFVSGFAAVLVALVAVGPIQALIMLAGIIVVMQVEGHILQPFLLGRAVHLHPLAVLLAIAIGIVIAGIVGALVAVPILAFVKTFIQELYRQSQEIPPAPPPEPVAADPIDSAASTA